MSGAFRGWGDMPLDYSGYRWSKHYKEALAIRKSILIAWSFHTYTTDPAHRVVDNSKNKCTGVRIYTKITDGQFGKALHLAPSSTDNQGAQVLAMLSNMPCTPIKQFSISFWVRITRTDTSPILSLLFVQKFTLDLQSAHQSLTFTLLYINSKGHLVLGQPGPESYYELKPQKWYHLVMTNDSSVVRIYVLHRDEKPASGDSDDEEGTELLDSDKGRYLEILSVPQQHPLVFEKLAIVLGNGKKGDFMVEEMSMLGLSLDVDSFWWLQHGFPFTCTNA